jgi:predicted dehydrogenase
MARARARCLKQIEQAQLVAVASRTKEKARQLAEGWRETRHLRYAERGARGASVTVAFDNHRDLLASGVDAVIVATPNNTHYQIMKDALEAGKDVLVEYPMVLNSQHASDIVRLADEKNALVEVGFDTRFDPLDRKLREAVHAGRIGELLWCCAELLYHVRYEPQKWYWQQEATRGMIVSWLVERFDLLRRMGGEVASVFASQAPEVHAGEMASREQTCVVNLQFKAGAVGVVSLSCLAPPGFSHGSVRVIGSRGALWCDGHTLRVFTPTGEQSKDVDEGSDPLADETAHFVDCVMRRVPAENPPGESLTALKVAEAALESLNGRTCVSLED